MTLFHLHLDGVAHGLTLYVFLRFLKQHKYTATAISGVQRRQGPGARDAGWTEMHRAWCCSRQSWGSQGSPGSWETLLPGDIFRLEGGVRMVY